MLATVARGPSPFSAIAFARIISIHLLHISWTPIIDDFRLGLLVARGGEGRWLVAELAGSLRGLSDGEKTSRSVETLSETDTLGMLSVFGAWRFTV